MISFTSISSLATVAVLGVVGFAIASCSSDGASPVTAPVATTPACGVGDAAACPPPPCPVVYVAPNGSDGATGCASNAALKTLGAAVAIARTNRATEIRACRGAYAASSGVVLDVPVSLHGGYTCDTSTWARADLPVSPTAADGDRLSVLTGGANGAAALFVRGDVSTQVTIDGFEVRAPATADGSAIALQVAGSASPHVTRSRLLGGAGISKNGVGSIGVVVEDTAAPVIDACTIDGGSGESTSGAGSIGVLVRTTSGAPRITNNVISGGSGKEKARSVGSVGVWIEGAPTLAGATVFTGNTVDGGDGTADAGGIPSVGIITRATTDLDVVDNRISGGSGHTTSPDAALRAVYAIGSGGLRLKRNRIFGGSSVEHVPAWAIDVRGARSVDIENNLVLVPEDGHAIVVGIDGETVEGARVRYNTMYARTTSPSLTGFALLVGSHARHTVVVNNLLMGDFGGVKVDNCPYVEPKELISDLRSNAWVVKSGVLSSSVCGASQPGPINTSDVAATDAAFTGATTGRNIRLATAAACAGDAACVAGCEGPAGDAGTGTSSCPDVLFDAWSATTNGKDELFAAGWKLAGTAPCALANGGLDLSADALPVTDDLLGVTRTPSPGTSIGGVEHDGACR